MNHQNFLGVGSIVLKPDPVIDTVDPPGHGSDGLTRVNSDQPKKIYKKQYGVTLSCFNIFFTFLLVSTFHLGFSFSALQENHSDGTYSGQINSNSVLVALLDSHYTELAELVEKALLLQTLEDAVGKHNITIFAPKNEALERDLDPEFKRFLLEPGNLKSLQTLLLYHIVPNRINPSHNSSLQHNNTLCRDRVKLSSQESGEKLIDSAKIIR
uniref:FAS1 domain-containing protein n=1 Tax=Populus trichocarpa TaxID=3694 RepID=A0A3N7H3Q0_POPTR